VLNIFRLLLFIMLFYSIFLLKQISHTNHQKVYGTYSTNQSYKQYFFFFLFFETNTYTVFLLCVSFFQFLGENKNRITGLAS
jgi:hypothetical protein